MNVRIKKDVFSHANVPGSVDVCSSHHDDGLA
jgi:hypothetical protein